jgi:hypothetical protein
MAKDYGKVSREALARANAISEIAIFWSLVVATVVLVFAMIRGMFG